MSPRPILALIIAFFASAPAGAESFKSWAARGAREERGKDPKAAFSSYSNALSAWKSGDGNSGKAKVLCARAGLREQDGDDAGALNDLSDCLALDKKNARAFHRRGALLLKAGKAPAAIDDFYRAIALDINFGPAYADRARAYEIQGEKGFAREDARRACDLGVKASCAKDSTSAGARSYRPKFKDCLVALDACVETGNSFGACVRAAPDCGAKAIKGCCPAACLKAYRQSLDRERSEAAAYREYFTPGAACGAPTKSGILDKR